VRLAVLIAHSRHGDVQHRHVADRLLAEFGDQVVAIVVATGRGKTFGQKIRAWSKRYSAIQVASRIAVRLRRRLSGRDDRRQEVFRKVLFPEGESGEMPGGDKIMSVSSHNGEECRQLLDRLQPDIVAVYGTLLIGRALIEASPVMINLHTGLSPWYRGSDTIFWPLHDGRPDKVGVTVHRLDPGIDSGAILARGRPAILPGDGEDEIFARAVKLGAELMCRAVVREFEGTARPLTQNLDEGKECRSVDRTLAADRRMRRQLASGMLAVGLEPWQEEF
jgi:methionyl-tRNA formyltransferase